MDIYSKEQKYNSIKTWKNSGLIYDDYDDLFEVYRKTLVCQHCNKEFKNKRDRQLDHNHETGLFRKIVCNKCNSRDSYINYPDGRDWVQYKKDYRIKNSEKINKQIKEKIKCDCGAIVIRQSIARHKRTAKHIDWWLNNVD